MNGKTFSIFRGKVNIKRQLRLYKSMNKSI